MKRRVLTIGDTILAIDIDEVALIVIDPPHSPSVLLKCGERMEVPLLAAKLLLAEWSKEN